MYKISEAIKESIKELYLDGMGSTAIEKKINVSRTSIVKILREYGIWEPGIRPWKNVHNIRFFKTYTRESCYWAGFILADGNLSSSRNCLRFCINRADDGHLKKFLKEIKCSGPIYYNNINNSANINISGKWFVNDLNNNFDIHSRKSLTAKFCKKIPGEFLSDYIRGYFDGDGCLTKNKSRCILDFTGNFRVLSGISSSIQHILDIDEPRIYTWKNRKCSRIAYDSKHDPRIILEWLYSTSIEQTRLDRKYEKYNQYTQKNII